MKDYIIRKVKKSDIESVENIAVEAFSVHYDFYREVMGDKIFNQVHKNWKDRKKKAVREACRLKGGNRVYVAEQKGRVIGFVTLRLNKDNMVGTIGNNSVRPKYQGKGIGKSLYNYAINVIKEEGMKCATVQTGLGSTYIPARRAYEKAGFKKQLQSVAYYMEL